MIRAAKQWQDMETVASDWELTATYSLIPVRSWPPKTRRPEYEAVYVFHYKPDEQRRDYQRHPNMFEQSWYLQKVLS